jgi:hypothetical protein
MSSVCVLVFRIIVCSARPPRVPYIFQPTNFLFYFLFLFLGCWLLVAGCFIDTLYLRLNLFSFLFFIAKEKRNTYKLTFHLITWKDLTTQQHKKENAQTRDKSPPTTSAHHQTLELLLCVFIPSAATSAISANTHTDYLAILNYSFRCVYTIWCIFQELCHKFLSRVAHKTHFDFPPFFFF